MERGDDHPDHILFVSIPQKYTSHAEALALTPCMAHRRRAKRAGEMDTLMVPRADEANRGKRRGGILRAAHTSSQSADAPAQTCHHAIVLCGQKLGSLAWCLGRQEI